LNKPTRHLLQELTARQGKNFQVWNEIVERSPVQDVYYRPAYALAYESAEATEANALVLQSGQVKVLLPLMARRWRDSKNEPVDDAFSPYGYGGWLQFEGPPLTESEDLRGILSQLQDWANSKGIVCCVLRLHPLLPQTRAFEKLMARGKDQDIFVTPGSVTCAVDLSQWDEGGDRPKGMGRRRRTYLNKTRRELRLVIRDGWECVESASKELEIFRQMYDADMRRLDAPEVLRFDVDYFQSLARGLGKQFMLMLAYAGEEIVGGVIILTGPEFGHYHLSASNELGRQLRAATFLIVAGAKEARNRGCGWLHLGGGISPGDSLFEFKSSFGGQTFQYYTVTVVADSDRYEKLQNDRNVPWPYALSLEPRRQTAVVVNAKSALDPVVGIGAGGHARVVMEVLILDGRYEIRGLLDSNPTLKGASMDNVRVLGDDSLIFGLRDEGLRYFFVGLGSVGDCRPRARLYKLAVDAGLKPVTTIHPDAVMSASAKINQGATIMAGAIINSYAILGENVIVNTGAIVEHDCVVQSHVHIASRAVLASGVHVGEMTHIGAGAIIRQGIEVGEGVTVGAGAVVVKDVAPWTVVTGVPAHVLRQVAI